MELMKIENEEEKLKVSLLEEELASIKNER